MINFLDTSAILAGALNKYTNVWVSAISIQELENIKTSRDKDDETKFRAREATRLLTNTVDYQILIHPNSKLSRERKKYSFLNDINDHNIICSALVCQNECGEDEFIQFITGDLSQFLFARATGAFIVQPVLYTDSSLEEEFCGWGKYFPDEKTMALLYTDPKMNALKCKNNEFAEIFEDGKLKDVLFWDGSQYRKLKYKEFIAPTGERIVPRNLEQKMDLDLLQNENIPIKLCIGRFGTGKSLFAETWAANQVVQGKFDKIIFVKNNLDVKGAGKLGTLPGDEIDKQYPWLRQIEDHLGPQLFEEYLSDGRLEPAHLSTLRGRDLKNSLILVDEAENLLVTNIQLLLGRVAENSQIIFCADVKQCDYKDEKMSGIPKMIECLAGNSLFGMVKLIKSERSLVSQCADLLD